MTLLMSVGHRWADIQNYTLSQIRLFGKAAGRFYSRNAAQALRVTAVGSRGDEKVFEQTMSSLLKG